MISIQKISSQDLSDTVRSATPTFPKVSPCILFMTTNIKEKKYSNPKKWMNGSKIGRRAVVNGESRKPIRAQMKLISILRSLSRSRSWRGLLVIAKKNRRLDSIRENYRWIGNFHKTLHIHPTHQNWKNQSFGKKSERGRIPIRNASLLNYPNTPMRKDSKK